MVCYNVYHYIIISEDIMIGRDAEYGITNTVFDGADEYSREFIGGG